MEREKGHINRLQEKKLSDSYIINKFNELQKLLESKREVVEEVWINIKEKLPNPGEVTIIKLKFTQPTFCIAQFFDNLSTCNGDYTNIFIVMVHPKFPKTWLFTEEYKKISRIPKNKVDFWMPIPKPPKVE